MGKIEFVEVEPPKTRIKVIGVGGGGSNAVDSMIDLGITGVEFCNINTDSQALALSKSPNKLHIGDVTTHGMGCGGDPALGEKAALEAKELIAELLSECEMVFIAAGLGGGTGTGASVVVAEIAKSLGILTVAIVTKPFSFEGPQRSKRAEQGLNKLSEFVDTKIVILNDKLIEQIGAKTPLTEAFDLVNRILAEGVHAISDLISVPGQINVDFMDVRSIMGETGGAVMGVGIGKGENRAVEAVKKACASPLQEKIVIQGARGVLISICASADITLQEIHSATNTVYDAADPDANIIFGLVINPDFKDEMRVTIIATGFPDDDRRAFIDRQEAESRLAVAPKGNIDFGSKLKSMMQPEEQVAPQQPQQPVQPVQPQVQPAPQPTPEPTPQRQTPAREMSFDFPTDRQATTEPQQNKGWGRPEIQPHEQTQPTQDSNKPTLTPDTDEPAYNRRRRTLFE